MLFLKLHFCLSPTVLTIAGGGCLSCRPFWPHGLIIIIFWPGGTKLVGVMKTLKLESECYFHHNSY